MAPLKNPLSNPLLRLVRKSPMRLGGFHGAQVLLFALMLIVYAASVWLVRGDEYWGSSEMRRAVRSWVWVVPPFYTLLIGPIATLVPAVTVLVQFMRIDHHRHWEAILLTPVTSFQWLARLLVPACFPTVVFLIGMGLCVFWLRYSPTIFDHFSIWETCLYFVPIYAPVQCVWSAAVMLFFLARHRRIGLACAIAFPLIIAPGFLLFTIVTGNDIVQWLMLVNGLKLLLLLPLLWYLQRTLRDRLALRVEG